jgi:hypothetical protein
MPPLSDLYCNSKDFIVFDECTNSWYCKLCTTGPMPTPDVIYCHKNGRKHSTKVKFAELKYEPTMPQRVTWCIAIGREIEKLPLERWKWHMNHLCHTFVTSRPPPHHESTILDTLAMYQAKEKLSLLDLAIWKHYCVSSFAEMTGADDTGRTVSMQDMQDYGTLNERFAPAAFRHNVRAKGGASVIIEHVLPFLGRRF